MKKKGPPPPARVPRTRRQWRSPARTTDRTGSGTCSGPVEGTDRARRRRKELQDRIPESRKVALVKLLAAPEPLWVRYSPDSFGTNRRNHDNGSVPRPAHALHK